MRPQTHMKQKKCRFKITLICRQSRRPVSTETLKCKTTKSQDMTLYNRGKHYYSSTHTVQKYYSLWHCCSFVTEVAMSTVVVETDSQMTKFYIFTWNQYRINGKLCCFYCHSGLILNFQTNKCNWNSEWFNIVQLKQARNPQDRSGMDKQLKINK